MKYRKYLVFIMILMLFGINEIYAETCYYQTSEVALEYEPSKNQFTIKQRGAKTDIVADNEPLINKNSDKTDESKFTGMTVKKITTECPNYVVYRRKERALWWASDGIWGFDNASDASKFASASSQTKKMFTWQSARQNITKEQFESNIERNVTAIINNSNISYGANGITTSDKQMSCDELFDSSIMEIINDILKDPRYIVPALILLLGTLDFLKAVMASKEDEMKKAQRTFIKRIIIGVAVFLVPVFMNAIIWLANLAWKGLGYTTCNF